MESFIEDVKELGSYSIGDWKMLKILGRSLVSTALWAHPANILCDHSASSPCSESMDFDFEEMELRRAKLEVEEQ